jgi:ATP-dependent protease ClpP protease subunit
MSTKGIKSTAGLKGSEARKSKGLKTLLDLEIEKEQLSSSIAVREPSLINLPTHKRTLRYIGSVTRVTSERILKEIGSMMGSSHEQLRHSEHPQQSKEIALFVSSPGGMTGVAMSFYDTVRHVLKPDLVTIGSGDVDSSGVIIFLSGSKRYVSARTTMLLHPAGRIFGNQRYTTQEMEAMLAEDKLKDEQYAQVIADNSKGQLTRDEVLLMMHKHTVLSPSKMLEFGLADAILA